MATNRMEVVIKNVGQRYRYEWIFRKVNLHLQDTVRYALTGPNGSGKSTFLRILSGHLTPSKGKVAFLLNGQSLEIDSVYRHVSLAAPYIELIEELTLQEAIVFHQQFKSFYNAVDFEWMVDLLGFSKSIHKQIRYFSSGMKQRLKLALAICSDTPLLLLDEPSTNLDEEGIDWYHDLIKKFGQNRLVVVASNVTKDFDFCEEKIDILDFKP